MSKFWNWIQPVLSEAGETEEPAHLVLTGEIVDDEEGEFYRWIGADAMVAWPAQLREEMAEHDGEDIVVEINSPGGEVFAGMEIHNILRQRSGRTVCRVTGLAASAASIVAMGGDTVEMCEQSMMMIHNPWTVVSGNADQLREQAEVLDTIAEVIRTAYMRRFKGTEDELATLLRLESWLTPNACIENGLADAVFGAQETVSDAMTGRYAALTREDIGSIRARFGIAEKPAEPSFEERRAAALASVDDLLREVL